MNPTDLSPQNQARFDRLSRKWAEEDALAVGPCWPSPSTIVALSLVNLTLWSAIIETAISIEPFVSFALRFSGRTFWTLWP